MDNLWVVRQDVQGYPMLFKAAQDPKGVLRKGTRPVVLSLHLDTPGRGTVGKVFSQTCRLLEHEGSKQCKTTIILLEII